MAAVACRDRAGRAYEITLELSRNSAPFASVGERCGHQLARLADGVRAARRDPEQAAMWPDPDDRFPAPARIQGRHDYQPGDDEFFTLRARARGDLPGSGELRCTLRSSADWIGECTGLGGPRVPRQRAWPGPRAAAGQERLPGGPGGPVRTQSRTQELAQSPNQARNQPGWPGSGLDARGAASGYWRLTRRAVVEAWGGDGIGIRAVLTSAELVRFLDTVLTGPDGCVPAESAPVGETTTSGHTGEAASPVSRLRGRVPDGSSRSRLPALRAQARGIALAERDPSSCRGDVRR